jgi:hypothetical protein
MNIEVSMNPLFARIGVLRRCTLEDGTLARYDELNTAIVELDGVLKREMKEVYGDENFRRHVPEWHKLIGSTPENHDMPEEARAVVVRKIECLVEAFEIKWGL